MLILKRTVGKCIEIQVEGMEPIIVSVLGIDEHGAVSVGVHAPREVTVHRQEIADKIRSNGERGNRF